ncbi:MAG: nuclear transport factor 2 family protein [Gammaproteobacteria bacterium]|nr:nuclear transport factor 2 family protein [Gammaproteobacteria bacterium]MDH5728108.1 nuclear transport factor 2 family protein [Gammaproteobacteria bacterium]
MHQDLQEQINHKENQLKQAMLDSNVALLDELLSPDLIFTNHLGHIMHKQDDLGAHQSGLLKIERIETSEQQFQVAGDVIIVTVKARILGSFAGESNESDFRFTRIWQQSAANQWQIICAHSCLCQ